MYSKFFMFAFIVAIALVVGGCGDDVVFPESPAMGSGISDSQGVVTLEIGPYNITYETVNENGSAVSGIYVVGYVLHEHLTCVASDGNAVYYPTINVLSLEDLQGGDNSWSRPSVYGYNSGLNPAARPMDTEFTVELVMENSDVAVHGYDTEPENMDLVISDDWTVPSSAVTDMQGLYDYANTSAFHNSVIIYLSPDVAASVGAGRQTASFLMSEINSLPVFTVLAGLGLSLYSGDSVNVSTFTYQDIPMPVIYISSIAMHRDFWKQFTLTWGENPGDLDSHLWTPSINNQVHHIFYANQGSPTSGPFAELDVDDVTSYGPEHITIFDMSVR